MHISMFAYRTVTDRKAAHPEGYGMMGCTGNKLEDKTTNEDVSMSTYHSMTTFSACIRFSATSSSARKSESLCHFKLLVHPLIPGFYRRFAYSLSDMSVTCGLICRIIVVKPEQSKLPKM